VKTQITRTSAKTPPSSNPQKGFSLIELLIVVAIILIIAAIAIPNLLNSKKAANQGAAVSSLRTITTASVSYSVTYSNGYPPALASLGGVEGTAATCSAAILIDQVVASPPYQKSGYQFAYSGQEGNVTTPAPGCTPGFTGYLVTAVPLVTGLTGNISYCSDESGVLHFDPSGALAPDEATCDNLQPLQ
jgi:type IV pilus assembly protein PilA